VRNGKYSDMADFHKDFEEDYRAYL